ncbi:MAG: hypothetical protein LH616_04885 [Ilumatobacteraceae bacterium]|nr:hypothetical protein [Ilumatobacteraceae bacterium]
MTVAATAFVTWRWKQLASSVPPIHDVIVDVLDAPRLMAILLLRATAKISAEYGGGGVAALHRNGYPGSAPATVPPPADEMFTRVWAAVGRMG